MPQRLPTLVPGNLAAGRGFQSASFWSLWVLNQTPKPKGHWEREIYEHQTASLWPEFRNVPASGQFRDGVVNHTHFPHTRQSFATRQDAKSAAHVQRVPRRIESLGSSNP